MLYSQNYQSFMTSLYNTSDDMTSTPANANEFPELQDINKEDSQAEKSDNATERSFVYAI